MPRGISREDVWKACDALLLEGGRPTIERIRQKLCTGSPNTVSPHLDTWFKHLGGRLKDPGAFSPPPDIPDPVLQAAKHFWDAAQAEARRDFDQRLSAGLAAAVANVESEKERARIADAAAFEASGKAARMQAELSQRVAAHEQDQQARLSAEGLLVEARRQIDRLRERLDAATSEIAAVREAAQREIAVAIERFTAAERRAALDVDAERTARAKTERRAETLERRVDDLQAQLHDQRVRQQEAQARLQRELAAAQAEAARESEQIEALQKRGNELSATLTSTQSELQVARAEAAMAERLLSAGKSREARKRTSRPSSAENGRATP